MFAFFWIVLAGVSGLYLFMLFTDPAALGSQAAQVSALGDTTPTGTTPPDAPPMAAPPAAGNNSGQVAALEETIRALRQQVAELDARLKPIERFVGPVAALPPAASVTTSPPAPQAAPAEATEDVTVEETEEVVEDTPPPPTPAPAPQAEPEPEPEAAPPETAEAPEEAPEPPVVAEAPEAAPEAMEDTPAETAPAEEAAAEPAAAPASTDEVEIAAFDPVALPPTANDGSTRYGIEIGTVKDRDDLRPLWREFLTKHAALVAGLQPRRVKAPDNSWRLIAGPFTSARDAEGACTLFKKAERPCAATVYAGDAL